MYTVYASLKKDKASLHSLQIITSPLSLCQVFLCHADRF